jgi:hypothetical protein
MGELTIDQEAEQVLRTAAAELTDPGDRECLACFVARMLDEFGCDNTLRFALRHRDLQAPRAHALEHRLGRMGGYCDCEVLMNAYQLADDLLERDEDDERHAPAQLPDCRRVRFGSTQPCANWVRQRRGW